MLENLSYRYKVPIRSTILILLTATAVAAALIYRAADDLRSDMIASAESMSRILARTIEPALRRDDIWTAYEIVTSPFHGDELPTDAVHPEAIIVLDEGQRVYAASDPRRFPVLSLLAEAGSPYTEVQHLAANGIESPLLETDENGRLHMITPVLADGIAIGTLIVSYPGDAFSPRFIRFAGRAGAITAIVLAVLVPVSWFWAIRMAQPLVQLAHCMGQIGSTIPDDLACILPQSRDELGRVGSQFQRMIKELRDKQALEQQVIAAERLAAMGRITAGIAHEINNPLGGMLNTLSTFRRYGAMDEMTQKSVSLLERGLLQIRDTVSALLVETRPEQRPLTHEDVEDVRTLISAAILRKSVFMAWDNGLGEPLPVSSTLVRQVLINLLLNAVNAVSERGRISFRLFTADAELRIMVQNDGAPIAAERMAHLFEPFAHTSSGGNGLGLWVSYQIIQQLGGTILAHSQEGDTRFTVTIPIP